MLDRWLAAAGLERLYPAFREHGIEEADLRELTDDELRELGLTIGERKRFRRALGASAVVAASGELRPLTLAFVDLVGSATLCEELDVEDMFEVLRLYRERCCSAIGEYGGHVAHLLGDGILAYFGYPAAHEDDCERAVRAAFDIAETVPRLETPARRPLAVRCGIATGRVVVTELVAGTLADRQTVTGSTANIAARLQEIAPPNGVVLSEATAGRVAHLFSLAEMPARRLKGFAEPMRSFRVEGRRSQPQSPDDGHDALLAAFVGRTAERAALEAAWREVQGGTGRVVLLRGEPGMGKSRLAGRFLAGLGADADGGPGVLRFHASALDQHSPLRPFLGYMRRRLGLPESARNAEIAEAVGRMLEGATPETVAALAGFLAPDLDGDASDGAERRREIALAALAELASQAAGRRPLVVLVEDAHWLDASSKDLLVRVITAARDRALLVLATSRRSLQETLPGVDPAIARDIPLGPLSREEVSQMVEAAFGDEPVPRDAIAALAERTDGVPLFIGELLRPLLRSTLPADWSSIVARRAGPTGVPQRLHEALAARLDALGSDKEVAQVAAVLGRSVDARTLARVMDRTREELVLRLEALCEAGVLRIEPETAGRRYAFRHALFRDAAYDSLLRRQRQQLHLRCAETLQALAPVFCAERPDVIARHLAEGGREAESLPCWLAAGRAAAARSALHEARHQLERGWQLASNLPQTPEMLETRLEFASLLGPVLFALCGPGSQESRAVYAKAVELAEAASTSANHFAVLWGWWRISKDFRVKTERAEMLMTLAEHRGEAEMLLQAHHCNWASAFHAGAFDRCRWHIEQGVAVYNRPDCDKRPWLFGNHDAKVCAHGELAQLLWMVGRPRAALAEERMARLWAARDSHAGTLAHAFDLTLLHRYYRRDVDAVRNWAERLIALADDRSMPDNRARGRLYLGWALAEQGDADAGLKIFEEAFRQQRAVGTDEDMQIYECMRAEILNRNREHARALENLREVQAALEELGIRNWAAEIWRLIGEATLASAPDAMGAARAAFVQAAGLAAAQGAAMLELRALLSMADALPRDAETGAVYRRIAALRREIGEAGESVDLARADMLARRQPELARVVGSGLT